MYTRYLVRICLKISREMTQILGGTRPQKYLKGGDLKRRVSNRESWNSDLKYSTGKKSSESKIARLSRDISTRIRSSANNSSHACFKISTAAVYVRYTSANISSRPLFVSFLAEESIDYELSHCFLHAPMTSRFLTIFKCK